MHSPPGVALGCDLNRADPERPAGPRRASPEKDKDKEAEKMAQTVVITGASAGIGRATARLYGERGANVGLIARGQAGLEGAVRDVIAAGGKALAVTADVADYAQVEQAARKVEEFFGPIDVWINVAFTSVFAPFAELSAEEFRRVTEVSYLGFVHGTMAALARMRPRDHGTIVQVGSALGSRSIPLQSAYCGAKHAINGFTSSLRCELLHDHSGVRVTVVQMPAVNTPQFSWVRSRMPHHPQPVPPIYQPEVAARGVLYAADHPRRRQYLVGASTTATIVANKLAPALLDRYLARTGYRSQQTDRKADADRPDNLWQAADGAGEHDYGARGIFDNRSHDRSPQLWIAQHPRLSGALAAATATATAAFLTGRRARRE
jgi:NAD(P)-dependent dehydrogenase (short-subunit alcohol dehydrogenase family)